MESSKGCWGSSWSLTDEERKAREAARYSRAVGGCGGGRGDDDEDDDDDVVVVVVVIVVTNEDRDDIGDAGSEMGG